jgi:hypothetical protein
MPPKRGMILPPMGWYSSCSIDLDPCNKYWFLRL